MSGYTEEETPLTPYAACEGFNHPGAGGQTVGDVAVCCADGRRGDGVGPAARWRHCRDVHCADGSPWLTSALRPDQRIRIDLEKRDDVCAYWMLHCLWQTCLHGLTFASPSQLVHYRHAHKYKPTSPINEHASWTWVRSRDRRRLESNYLEDCLVKPSWCKRGELQRNPSPVPTAFKLHWFSHSMTTFWINFKTMFIKFRKHFC